MALFDDNWELHIDIQQTKRDSNIEFQEHLKNIIDRTLITTQNGFQSHNINSKVRKSQEHKVELNALIEKNKLLKQEIEKKMLELEKNKAESETCKHDQKLLSQEIKDTHEAFLMARKYYKKHLKMYYTIDSTKENEQIIFVQFFTENRRDHDNYSVLLSRDIATDQYKLLETTPKIKNFSEIQTRLQETKDIPEALCHIREIFLKLKQNK